MILILFDPGAIDSMMRDFIPDPIAAIVRPDGGSHQRIETESSEMYREIERCAAEMLLAFDQVPQDGTEAEGFHARQRLPGWGRVLSGEPFIGDSVVFVGLGNAVVDDTQ